MLVGKASLNCTGGACWEKYKGLLLLFLLSVASNNLFINSSLIWAFPVWLKRASKFKLLLSIWLLALDSVFFNNSSISLLEFVLLLCFFKISSIFKSILFFLKFSSKKWSCSAIPKLSNFM